MVENRNWVREGRFPWKAGQRNSKIPPQSPLSSESITEREHQRMRERAWKCFCFATSPFEYQIMNPFSTQRPRGVVCKLYFAIMWINSYCQNQREGDWGKNVSGRREVTWSFNQGLLRGAKSPGPRQRSKGDRQTDNHHYQLLTTERARLLLWRLGKGAKNKKNHTHNWRCRRAAEI